MTYRGAAADLAASNIFYRRPDLYDQVQDDPNDTVARNVERLVAEHAPGARTVLDLGCGTGRDIEYLSRRFACVGVDVQPQMVAHAGQVRPHLDVRVGDMRSFRLGRAVDVITCLGNALAYLHRGTDLAAAFATFATHAHAGTLLILSTVADPVLIRSSTHRVDTADLHGQVTISYAWDEEQQVNTMRRVWQLDDGTYRQDEIRRRVVALEELRLYATTAGFCPSLAEEAGNYWIATFPGTD